MVLLNEPLTEYYIKFNLLHILTKSVKKYRGTDHFDKNIMRFYAKMIFFHFDNSPCISLYMKNGGADSFFKANNSLISELILVMFEVKLFV